MDYTPEIIEGRKIGNLYNQIEKVICAANWYRDIELKMEDWGDGAVLYPININSGLVFCGHRHNHCLYSMCAITGLKQHDAGFEIQGFLTNHNRFVDRKEGARLHLMNGGELHYGNILYSEDIY